MSNQHRIVCAAIRLANGQIICGIRHFDEVMRMFLPVEREELAGHEQGFLDNRRQFLSREAAWKVALAAKQVDPSAPEYSGIVGTLFSEDLY